MKSFPAICASVLVAITAHAASLTECRQQLHAGDGWAVAAVKPLTRIWADDAQPETERTTISIRLARNEQESREWLLLAPAATALADVTVTIKEKRPVSGRIAPLIEVGPSGSVLVDAARPANDQKRAVFDVLLPNRTFAVPANSLQGGYLRVTTNAATTPGRYRYELQVTVAGTTKELPIKVDVWNFQLPAQPPFPGWMHSLAPDLLFGLKIEPGWWQPPFKDIDHEITPAEWSAARQSLADWFAAGHVWAMIGTPGVMLNGTVVGNSGNTSLVRPSAKRVVAMQAYWRGIATILRDQGRLGQAALYVWDEPHWERFGEVREICDWVHAADRELRTQAVGWHDLRALRDSGHVDVYVPITFSYEPAKDNLPGDRAQTWWYTCDIPAPEEGPTLMLDSPPVAQRAMGRQSWAWGGKGFVQWETVLAHWNKSIVMNPPTTTCGKVELYGNGTLMYHIAGQWVPSQRLLHLSDGMEDAQYAQLAEVALRTANEERKTAIRQALAAFRATTGETLNGYSREPGAYFATRAALADLISVPLQTNPTREVKRHRLHSCLCPAVFIP